MKKTLENIFKQLDDTRLALHRNLIASDDDLEATYNDFLYELTILNIKLDKLEIKELKS